MRYISDNLRENGTPMYPSISCILESDLKCLGRRGIFWDIPLNMVYPCAAPDMKGGLAKMMSWELSSTRNNQYFLPTKVHDWTRGYMAQGSCLASIQYELHPKYPTRPPISCATLPLDATEQCNAIYVECLCNAKRTQITKPILEIICP